MNIKQAVVVSVNQSVFPAQERLIGDLNAIIAQQDNSRFESFELRNNLRVVDVAGPESFQRDNGQMWRHRNTRMERENRLVAEHEGCVRPEPFNLLQNKTAVEPLATPYTDLLKIDPGRHPAGRTETEHGEKRRTPPVTTRH